MSVEQFNDPSTGVSKCYPNKIEKKGNEQKIEPQLFGVYVNESGEKVRIPLAKTAIPIFPDPISHPTIVPENYKGNIDDACEVEMGTQKYAGLKRHKFESSTKHYLIGYSEKDDSPISCFINYYIFFPPRGTFVFPQYSARYWAGIDCSGLVQRSVNSADKLTVLGAKSSVLELSTGSCDANAESCPACNEVGSQTFIPKYASRIYDSNPKTTTIKERAKALSKVRKGDLAVYKKYVALVHSNELTCGGITKDKNGKDQIDCTYDVIHAYGLDCMEKQKDGSCKPGAFSRKVLTTPNNFRGFPYPTGFGRIKLWD